jgi:putative acetyltransferase
MIKFHYSIFVPNTNGMRVQIRAAFDTDTPAILDVVMSAFDNEQGQEIANLIIDLLKDRSAQPVISLVATTNDRVVGHVLFTSTRLKQSLQIFSSAILAPLSVHSNYQNQGIGGQLILGGLNQLKEMGIGLVFVLGHSAYYPKYGFVPAGVRGFEAPYPIPPEHADAWMVQELQPGIIGSVTGQVECADPLNDPKHWRE